MFARNDPAGRDVQHVCYFQYLMEGYGLSATQAANFFKNDTIITMGLQGNATLVNFASIIYGTRFVGD